MQKLFTTLLACTLVLAMSVSTMAGTGVSKASVMAGVTSSDNGSTQNVFDEFGYGGGVLLEFTPFLGVTGFYDQTPMKDSDLTLRQLAAHLALTLHNTTNFSAMGLVGFDWNASNMNKFNYDDPKWSMGALLNYGVGNDVAVWVKGTTPMTPGDDEKLFDQYKVAGGLMYTF